MNPIALAVICGLVGIVIGALSGRSVLRRHLYRQVMLRLDEDDRLIGLLEGTILSKAKEPYWSCQSTTAGQLMATELLDKASKLIARATELPASELDKLIATERRVRAKLDAALTLLVFIEKDVTALIGRIHLAVDGTQERLAELQRLLAALVSDRAAAGLAPGDAAARIEGIGTVLAKQAGAPIARAPVTTLRVLNDLLGTMNLGLREIVGAAPADPAEAGKK